MPQNESEFSSSNQSCFSLLQGPRCRKSPSALFRPNWVKHDYNPRSDGKKLTQLDLQSVEKVPFSTFASDFPPKMLEIGLPRLRISRRFLQDLSRAVCRFSSGLVAGNHRQHFFDPTGSSAIQSPIGSKKKITCSFYPTTRRQ